MNILICNDGLYYEVRQLKNKEAHEWIRVKWKLPRYHFSTGEPHMSYSHLSIIECGQLEAPEVVRGKYRDLSPSVRMIVWSGLY
jgi:hypothetical protein